MNRGIVFDIRKSCWHDGPGLRTTVFLKGCPLDCAWCHNPEGRSPEPELSIRAERCIGCGACANVCPTGAASDPAGTGCIACGACADVCPAEARRRVGIPMTVAAVMAEIEKDRPFYEETGGGATFSGGEPLASPDFLLAILGTCREQGIRTAVETSLFAPWDVVARTAALADLLLCDLKIVDGGKHRAMTGAHNALILDNLRILARLGAAVRIRTPVVPGMNDADADIEALAAFVGGLGAGWPVELLPYHDSAEAKYRSRGGTYPLAGILPPDLARMENIAARLRAAGIQVTIGGAS
ncbi:MAG: glycyl-radical enzyme activating protein [Spirochaetes bacterium]|nr:glycyl-radical enzyme activating protein [Spirochaetota bacterium]